MTELYHHGIKGQRWGIRRYQNEDGSLTEAGKKRYKNSVSIGNGLYLLEQKPRGIGKILSKYSNKMSSEQKKSHIYDISNLKEKIGNLDIYDEDLKTTNIAWIDINKKERGKKYAQTVMDYVIHTERKNGKNYLTLEVPGDSPDARHIYEKKGFVEDKQLSDDDVWGGLTAMKKRL